MVNKQPSGQAGKHRLGSLHVGRDKRIYRVSWANAAKKTKVWRLNKPYKPNKSNTTNIPKQTKPVRRKSRLTRLSGGHVLPDIPFGAKVQWCRLFNHAKKIGETNLMFINTYMMPISRALEANFKEPIDDSDICVDTSNFGRNWEIWGSFMNFFRSMQQGQQSAKDDVEKSAYKDFFERTRDVLNKAHTNFNDV